MFSFIDGKKTYILGALTILIGVAELLGIDVVAGVDQNSAIAYIITGFGLITGKSALSKLEN